MTNHEGRNKEQEKSFSSLLKEILSTREELVKVANKCDRAYAEGTGNADWYTPFGEEKSEHIAQNVAGLQAVMSGISILCLLRGVDLNESGHEALSDIANGELSDQERGIMLRLANCAWGAGQAFRTDRGPLGRATNMNIFDTLPKDEVDKDYHQIKAAAEFMLEKTG